MICWQPPQRAIRPHNQQSNPERSGRKAWLTIAAAALLVSFLPSRALATSGALVEWDPSPSSGIVGYRVYYGAASRGYTNYVSVGNVTNAPVTGLKPGTTYYFCATALTSTGQESGFSNEVLFSTPAAATNTAPTITSVPNQVLPMGASTPSLGFTVADAETAAGSLLVTAASSNTGLVPLAGIVLGGTGSSRTVTVTPAAGQYGTATISLRVSDGALTTITSFLVTVNPPPTIALTSPNNGTSFAAPATLNLAASVNPNGNTLSKVQFFSGSTLLGEDLSAPYSWTWGNVAAGAYTLSARLVYNGSSSVQSAVAMVTVTNVVTVSTNNVTDTGTPLPDPWQVTTLGAAEPGSAGTLEGNIVVSGAGRIHGGQDAFTYAYQPLSANGDIFVRFESMQGGNADARAGIMIRESLTATAMHLFLGVSPSGEVELQGRTDTGLFAEVKSAGTAPPYVWLRIVKKSKLVAAYVSSDSKKWTQVGSISIPYSSVYVGLAVASGDPSAPATASFSSVYVQP